ncbi:MAG: porin [Acidiferrobacterales bacterium]
MNKKLLTLAIAGALAPLAAPMTAMADVTVGGYAHVSVDSMKNGASGTAEKTGTYVSSNATNLVISGKTDIGGGMKALFSSQTFLSLGSDNNPPSPNPAGFSYDQFSNGNTYAGLAGDFGTVAAGRNDSPMKQLGRAVDLFGNEIGDSRNIITAPAYTGAPTSYGFDQRPGHTLFYVSPSFAGVTVKAAYTVENSNTSGAGLSGTPTQTPGHKASETSASVVYNQGGLLAGLSYEYHSASIYSTPNAEKAIRAAGSYTFSFPLRIVALVQQDSDIAGVSTAKRNVFGLGVSYQFIPNYGVKVQYYDAAKVDGTVNTGGKMAAVGVFHNFSKQSEVYLDYAKTTNNANAMYNAFAGGHGNTVGTVAGENPSGASIGMIYSF